MNKKINRPNHCPNFAASDLGDVETGKMYHPRTERGKTALEGQIRMEIRPSMETQKEGKM